MSSRRIIHPLAPKNEKKQYTGNKEYRPVCLKCGTEKTITRHHVIPKVHLSHFGIKNLGAPTVSLCQKCHCDIERKILWTEAFTHRGQLGQRIPLNKVDDYWYILAMFIGMQRFSELLREGKVPKHPTNSAI